MLFYLLNPDPNSSVIATNSILQVLPIPRHKPSALTAASDLNQLTKAQPKSLPVDTMQRGAEPHPSPRKPHPMKDTTVNSQEVTTPVEAAQMNMDAEVRSNL